MTRPTLPTAADLMQRHLQTVLPDAKIEDAVRLLLAKGHAAAPVVDASGKLLGLVSEHDCVRVLCEAIAEGWPSGLVRDHMTKELETVSPADDVLSLSARFTNGRHRRLLVVDQGRLVGLIARRDLMRALESMERERTHARSKSTYELLAERHRNLD
ncbi:MAG: CBS domain-containing protein [Deltaproteobacteria bacterium]|nr:CBS domain-containing protein [Deltaproteobacteria bacterium]